MHVFHPLRGMVAADDVAVVVRSDLCILSGAVQPRTPPI